MIVPSDVPDSALIAVHPTMLYSALALILIFALLWALRHRREPVGWLFGLYLVLTGIERFLVEFIRAKDDRLLWGFTTAQARAVMAIVGGSILLVLLHSRVRRGTTPAVVGAR